MKNMLDELVQLIPPPPSPYETGDQDRWAGTESSLGILLPRDFCEIIDIYGTGIWSNFLYLLNPFSKNTHLKSRRSSQESTIHG